MVCARTPNCICSMLILLFFFFFAKVNEENEVKRIQICTNRSDAGVSAVLCGATTVWRKQHVF